MRKNYGNKPLCYPQPVFILCAYDKDGNANAMTAAWGGISDDYEIGLCISENHKTTANFLESGAFTVSCGEAKYTKECDYLGIASGNKEADKLKKCGFTTTKSEFVNAPIINELSVCIECKLTSYDSESCKLYGEIVNVSVDDRVLDENGKVDIKKVNPIAFDPFNHTYVAMNEVVGLAFKDGLEIK